MNRRDFIKKSTLAGIAAIGAAKSTSLFAAGKPVKSELIVAYDNEPEDLLRIALEAYGGLKKLIKPNATVFIKANFSFNGPPEQACSTNPDLLGALVKACRSAGARKVWVGDLTLDPAVMTLQTSGIRKAVTAAGGEVVDLRPWKIIEKPMPILTYFQVYQDVLKADCHINVPILKDHSGAKISGALKNLMGLTPDRQLFHDMGCFDLGIAELNRVYRPHLHLIDAYRILKTNGPRGPGQVVLAKQLILSRDPVAADAYAATHLLGLAEYPSYIKLAERMKLGCSDLSNVTIKKVKA